MIRENEHTDATAVDTVRSGRTGHPGLRAATDCRRAVSTAAKTPAWTRSHLRRVAKCHNFGGLMAQRLRDPSGPGHVAPVGPSAGAPCRQILWRPTRAPERSSSAARRTTQGVEPRCGALSRSAVECPLAPMFDPVRWLRLVARLLRPWARPGASIEARLAIHEPKNGELRNSTRRIHRAEVLGKPAFFRISSDPQ
jgi:hypothetical protein